MNTTVKKVTIAVLVFGIAAIFQLSNVAGEAPANGDLEMGIPIPSANPDGPVLSSNDDSRLTSGNSKPLEAPQASSKSNDKPKKTEAKDGSKSSPDDTAPDSSPPTGSVPSLSLTNNMVAAYPPSFTAQIEVGTVAGVLSNSSTKMVHVSSREAIPLPATTGGGLAYRHVAPPWTPSYEILSGDSLTSSGTANVQLVIRLQNPTDDTWKATSVRLFDRLIPSLSLTASCDALAPGETCDSRVIKSDKKLVGPVQMRYFKIWVAQIPEVPTTGQGTLQRETQAKLEYVLVNDVTPSDSGVRTSVEEILGAIGLLPPATSTLNPTLAAPFKLIEKVSGGTRAVAEGLLPPLEYAGYSTPIPFDPTLSSVAKFSFRVPSAGAPPFSQPDPDGPKSITLGYSDTRAGNSPGSLARTVTVSTPANAKDLKYPLLLVTPPDSPWNLATSGFFPPAGADPIKITIESKSRPSSGAQSRIDLRKEKIEKEDREIAKARQRLVALETIRQDWDSQPDTDAKPVFLREISSQIEQAETTVATHEADRQQLEGEIDTIKAVSTSSKELAAANEAQYTKATAGAPPKNDPAR